MNVCVCVWKCILISKWIQLKLHILPSKTNGMLISELCICYRERANIYIMAECAIQIDPITFNYAQIQLKHKCTCVTNENGKRNR